MNIFATSPCPIISAQDHNNVHAIKMACESMQILSTAHFVLDGVEVGMIPTHHFHPSCVWARASSDNYLWLFEHAKALCAEYEHRYGKVHKAAIHLEKLKHLPVSIQQGSLTDIARAMPDEFILKSLLDPCKSYQLYLNAKYKEWTTRTDKRRMKVSWEGKCGSRAVPSWVNY